MPWCVYIVECKDNKLYTGITNNLTRRIKEHNNGSGAKFTRCRLPVKLAYEQGVRGRVQALKLEARIKKLSRKAKLILTTSYKPNTISKNFLI